MLLLLLPLYRLSFCPSVALTPLLNLLFMCCFTLHAFTVWCLILILLFTRATVSAVFCLVVPVLSVLIYLVMCFEIKWWWWWWWWWFCLFNCHCVVCLHWRINVTIAVVNEDQLEVTRVQSCRVLSPLASYRTTASDSLPACRCRTI